MFDDAGFLDQRDVGRAAAVADGRLVGVHFDERVVHAEAGEGGENVFDGVDLDVAFDKGGGALDGADVGGEGVDGRLIFEVGATEFEAVIDGGRVDGEGDLFAGVERNARERGGTGQGVLFLHGQGGQWASGGQPAVHHRDLPLSRGGGFGAVGHHY